MSFTKFSAVTSILLGIAAILLPYLFGTLAVMMLGGVILASGITGLTALGDSDLVNPPVTLKIGLWTSIVLGVLIIVLGSTGSAILLGFILGVALISNGIQQWRIAV